MSYLISRLVFATIVLVFASTFGFGQAATQTFTAEQIRVGAGLYEANCAQCHGAHMIDPGGGYFDLRTFPADQHSRFINSVSNGKNNMPPWRSLLTPQQIDDLFAYVVAGER